MASYETNCGTLAIEVGRNDSGWDFSCSIVRFAPCAMYGWISNHLSDDLNNKGAESVIEDLLKHAGKCQRGAAPCLKVIAKSISEVVEAGQ